MLNAATLLLALLCAANAAAAADLADKLRDDSELSQFYSLLESNQIANSTLSLRSCTIFVPTNEAFQRYKSKTTHVLYHITTEAYTQKRLPNTVSSDMAGNPPLYITKNSNGDIFVNNARIIPSLSVETNSDGKRQIMHIIDEVLEPLTVKAGHSDTPNNPNALKFLKNAEEFNVDNIGVRTYRSQVTMAKKESVYDAAGQHTFLVPVDEGFKLSARSSLVDGKVIDGHVIPNTVIFTAAAQHDDPKASGAFEDLLKVTAQIYTSSRRTAKENAENGALRKFYEVIMDNGGAVLDDINSLTEVTILAPSNEAWNSSNINNVLRDTIRWENSRTLMTS
ncbi:GD19117 [Drosophila simulans]|uniref:GD19117 n=1 Tax=Drosophila simulans TaxID=7240 RepID=B4QWG2_DROSI|nr:GD19117 [Drosophila simulans]